MCGACACDALFLLALTAGTLQGIAEGRLIFDNLQKCICYVLASNVPEILPFLMFVSLQIPLALEIVQILAVDLGTDLMPAICMACVPQALPAVLFCNNLNRYELAEDDLMKRKPRNAQTDRLTNGRLFFLGYCTLGVRARAPAAVRDV